jgi:2'-5' RNA ligase
MLRLFVAVDLPASQQQAVAAVCTGVPGARWVKPHQLHITLRFMGQTPEEELPALRHRLEHVKAPSFRMSLRGIGVFPVATRRPRVLWLGLDPAEPLIHLKHEIDRAVGPSLAAHPRDLKQEFSAHLTLARLGGKPDEKLAGFLARHADHQGPGWEVTCFRLYRSTLHPRGAVHEPLATYPLT